MKRRMMLRILLVHLILAACVSFGLAQNANTAAPSPEVVTENDRLPFMHTENTEVQEPSSGGLLVKTLGAMILIVGLIFCGAWGAKKLGFGGVKTSASSDDPELAILSSVSLGSGRTISTVRFGERVLVVGSTAQAFTLLAEGKNGEQISFQNSRSVAELLEEEENGAFDRQFDEAQSRLQFLDNKGANL